jgi:hypothetical protein
MFLCFFIWNVQLIKCFWSFVFCRDEVAIIREIVQFITNYKNLQVANHPDRKEFPVQVPNLSSSPSGNGYSYQPRAFIEDIYIFFVVAWFQLQYNTSL